MWFMKRTFAAILLFLPCLSFAAKTHTQIAEEFGDTIVSVNVARKDGSTHSGTGFIVHPDGIIATAGHVVENAVFVNLTFKNGAISDEATILDVTPNKEIDLALLKISAKNLPHVMFKNSDYVRAGEEITVIGNPRRLQNTITNGLISQLRQVRKAIVWQQISAPISPSSSGSPVFNAGGYVIGVALSSLRGSDNQNLNFAIPSNYLMQLMYENNIAPELETKKSDASQNGAPLRPRGFVDKLRDHIKKSWYILKVRILQMRD
jgi:S1-C subfamily serine protease